MVVGELVTVESNDGTTTQDSIYCTHLFAGQTITAGSVCISSTGDALQINYQTLGGWELTEAHAWIGESITTMPQTRKGNPKVGNFPYNSGDITGATSYSFTIPIESLGGEPYVCEKSFKVAAHAALRRLDGDSGTYQTETGWGNGQAFLEKGSWAEYFTVNLHCEDDTTPPTPDKVCETAFAYGNAAATCFIGADFDGDGNDDGFNRWGWSNGPLGPGSYTYDIYQGAGRCDLGKGTVVGTLSIVYDGSSATVTYNTTAGYILDETHLYVGNEPLARDVNGEYTVAPGQYPNIHSLSGATSDSFTVAVTGDIYVVAHAVSCRDTNPEPPPPVVYPWSEFIASAAEVWPGVPSNDREIDTRAGSVEVNTNGGVGFGGDNVDPAFQAAIVTLRNGASRILEQKQVNRRWPPGLDANGCNPNKTFFECWLWRQADQDTLSALVPDKAGSSNDFFDDAVFGSDSPRVRISGGINYDYTAFNGNDNSHQTVTISWEVPEGRVVRNVAQALFRLRFDRCNNGLDASDLMIALFYANAADPSQNFSAGGVTIREDTATKLTIDVNVQTALQFVNSEYTRLGLTCKSL